MIPKQQPIGIEFRARKANRSVSEQEAYELAFDWGRRCGLQKASERRDNPYGADAMLQHEAWDSGWLSVTLTADGVEVKLGMEIWVYPADDVVCGKIAQKFVFGTLGRWKILYRRVKQSKYERSSDMIGCRASSAYSTLAAAQKARDEDVRKYGGPTHLRRGSLVGSSVAEHQPTGEVKSEDGFS